MPVKIDETQKVNLVSMQPTPTQWRKFREGRNARYWYAAMLSLQIFPNAKNKEVLKHQHPKVYLEYETRLAILLKRRVSYGAIRQVGKGVDTLTPPNQYVSIPGVATLACELGWDSADEFSKLVSPPQSARTLDGLSTLRVSDLEFEKQSQGMGRGEQLKTVRYAALVHLLRMAIDSPENFKNVREETLGRRKIASTQSLGAAVTKAVATLAKECGAARLPGGFGKDKNADEIAFAEKFAKTHF